MSRNIESIVHNHRVAAARRAANRPIWDARINIKGILGEYRDFGDDLTPEQVVEIYRRLHAALKAGVPAHWLDHGSEQFSFDLDELMDEFGQATPESFQLGDEKLLPVDELNDWLERLYDWADSRRVWLG